MTHAALVTGGVHGLGRAIAVGLQQAGYTVAASYGGSDDRARAFTQETGIPVFKFDVTDAEAVAAGLAEVEAAVGPVDVLVNNAGVTRDQQLHELPPANWSEVIETNLTSVYNCARQVIPAMRRRGFGRVINLSSVNGLIGQSGQTHYAAAKAGVIGFTKSLALETARDGITVNAIAPGFVATPTVVERMGEGDRAAILARIPVNRLGAPEDIAHCAVFLADEKSGFITGHTLNANGGQHMA
jgi:acetoacetyl-CoA reductase